MAFQVLFWLPLQGCLLGIMLLFFPKGLLQIIASLINSSEQSTSIYMEIEWKIPEALPSAAPQAFPECLLC